MTETAKGFDFWRLAEILVQLATPIAVAAFAFTFNASESHRDQRNKLEQERIARYALVPAYIDALAGDDLVKKDLAARSVTAILGADGEALLAALSPKQVAQLPPEAQQIISDASNSRTVGLVNGLFSSDFGARTNSYRDLVLGNYDAEKVIPIILQTSQENPNNLDGVANSLRYLENADTEGLVRWSSEVRAFLDQVSANGPNTRELANEVKSRLNLIAPTP